MRGDPGPNQQGRAAVRMAVRRSSVCFRADGNRGGTTHPRLTDASRPRRSIPEVDCCESLIPSSAGAASSGWWVRTKIGPCRAPPYGRANDLFAWLASGRPQTNISGRYPVGQVTDAFTARESRQTVGKLLVTH
jgi:hypothetical protein